MSFAFGHTSSAWPAPGQKFRKHEMTIANQLPIIRKLLRCRGNEVLKLQGASGNDQTVVEITMITNEPMNQGFKESTTVNRRINDLMIQQVNESAKNNEATNQ